MSKRLIALVLLVSMVLAVSGTASAQTRMGTWVDDVIFVLESDQSAGVTRLETGDFHVYAQAMASADLFQRVKASPKLDYYTGYGLYWELSFNPIKLFNDGRLNPFGVPRVREAMNILIDRDYIAKEFHGGLAVPRYLPLNTAFPDYALLADIARVLERKYAHNPVLAKQIISDEMVKMGATLVGGKWQYKGSAVNLIMLIRIEDERRLIGDYVAGLLEEVGFTLERKYVTGAQASPIWQSSDPKEGQWHLATCGWSTTLISRDQANNFSFFYCPRGQNVPHQLAMTPDPAFDALSGRLTARDFQSMAERRDLMAQALEMALKDSIRVWVTERISFFPRLKEVTLASDLAGGVSGGWLWAHTIRDGNKTGGTLRVAMTQLLVNPWNPVSGTNWLFDMMPIRSTWDYAMYPDPYTGLFWPHRIQTAELYVKKGLPVGKTHDWLTLNFVDENVVPKDAWLDWDAKAQKFITVGQKHPDGLKANLKIVVRYPADLSRHKWHDGSNISVADIVMRAILFFDRPNPDSKIHDSGTVAAMKTYMGHFRGWKIVSTSPLVIEYYSDRYLPDAENNVAQITQEFLWTDYAQGPGPWHTVALGVLCESEDKLAFSNGKAGTLKVEWLNYLSGPTVQILRNHLGRVLRDKYIPYEPTMRNFVTPMEAWVRWNNLMRWFTSKGHFWVGNGPLYVERAYPVEKVVHLKNFTEYGDPAGKWDRFGSPKMASTVVSGPARVAPGTAATFDIRVTTDGTPYAIADIAEVKFLLFDANGELALAAPAAAVSNGLWRAQLTAAQTAALPLGSCRFEAVVVSKLVSIPSFASFDFVIRR